MKPYESFLEKYVTVMTTNDKLIYFGRLYTVTDSTLVLSPGKSHTGFNYDDRCRAEYHKEKLYHDPEIPRKEVLKGGTTIELNLDHIVGVSDFNL